MTTTWNNIKKCLSLAYVGLTMNCSVIFCVKVSHTTDNREYRRFFFISVLLMQIKENASRAFSLTWQTGKKPYFLFENSHSKGFFLIK
jgi:hypothetical protein